MLKSVADFVATIPAMLAGETKLQALFVTYNSVGRYDSGPVETGKDGLAITVQNGNLHYSPVTNLVHSPQLELAMIGSRAMDEEAREALALVEKDLQVPKDDVPLLVFVYAGFSAFNEALSLVQQIKADTPKAKIVVTTCDCNLLYKNRVLVPMIESGEIEDAVCTWMCGGREMMADILKALIDAWPASIAA